MKFCCGGNRKTALVFLKIQVMSIRIRKCMCSNTGILVLHLIEFKIKGEGTEAIGKGHTRR